MVDIKIVQYIGGLSRLHIENDKASGFAKNLEDILQYAQKLDTLDVSNVKPTSHVLNVENVFRDDVVTPSLTQEEALAFAIEKHNGHYKVPKVIE
ncbi:MAG: Asp-tRNA(Asn)/Glu-tRNA(Gln) amidotransferase subunit GatC [Candidatus Omnitrophica bacterium]|nr:Asp-tRNA(Asn)/Glu-tRNA(Gln) amidotransferase subunit GatC [Candidatus Omnitrophota bacterium]